ncbi:MAG TPA: FeoA family protein [Polyangiaceae bacterium]|jgi:Fe2+ transport system protein FeoA|nr:FeoA family protein [Polyangiaceae bacterium]
MSLAETSVGTIVTVDRVGGERSYRRRLMELGLVPGTRVQVMGVAPLGDPIELLVRGSSLSIRRAEASAIEVRELEHARQEKPALPRAPLAASESVP